MVHVIAINIEGVERNVIMCCAICARKECSARKKIVWWEVFDPISGDMLDSADKFAEEQEGHGKEKARSIRDPWGRQNSL